MPIKINAHADNGIAVGFHKAVKLEVILAEDFARVSVQSYTNEAAYLDNLPIAWMWTLTVPVALLNGAGTLLDDIENALISEGSPFAGGERTSDVAETLDTLKARKRAEITRQRLAADSGHFVYQGHAIRTADKDMFDLLIANARISMSTEMPANWPGGWKDMNDGYLPIGSVDSWKQFFIAMYDTGIANFTHSQALKDAIASAATAEDVAAIYWGMQT